MIKTNIAPIMNDIKAINNLTNSFEDNSNKDLFKMLKLMQNEITKKFEKDYREQSF